MTNGVDKRFAELVLGRMKEKNLSLRALCRLAGMDPSLMSKILAGKRNPPEDDAVLRALALALELDPIALSVSVGRIPPEWRAICTDRVLFDAVRGLVEGVPVPRRPAAPRHAPAPEPQVQLQPRPAQMPEELL